VRKKEEELKAQQKKLTEKNDVKEDEAKAEQEKAAKRQRNKLHAQEKELHVQEKTKKGILNLKTAETLLNKSIIRKVCVHKRCWRLRSHTKNVTEAIKSVSDVHKKQLVIAEKRHAIKLHSEHDEETVKKRKLKIYLCPVLCLVIFLCVT